MKAPYQLGKLADLIQSSYILGYFSLLFRSQGIHSRGLNSLQSLVDSRHLSSPLASVIPVTTNACFSDVGFRKSNFFYGMGSLAPISTLLFYPDLGPAKYTHIGMDYPHRNEYTQAELADVRRCVKPSSHHSI